MITKENLTITGNSELAGINGDIRVKVLDEYRDYSMMVQFDRRGKSSVHAVKTLPTGAVLYLNNPIFGFGAIFVPIILLDDVFDHLIQFPLHAMREKSVFLGESKILETGDYDLIYKTYGGNSCCCLFKFKMFGNG